MSLNLSGLDYGIIALYFIFVFAVAFYVTKKERVKSDDYFLAGRNLSWFVIGASLFASNIGSEHLIGLAGAGASGGVAVAQFEILAGLILLLLGWVFVPFYLKSGVTTMPEFLEVRYSKQARNYLSFISVISYVLTKISVTIFAGAIVFEAIGLDFWLGAFTVVVATGIYTIFGGLKAVIYTDMIQMFIMIFGAIFVSVIGFMEVGGVSELRANLAPSFFSMWRPFSDPEFPWTGIIFGAPILGVWYWCTDQFIVQRVLSAKNLSHARRGTIFGGFLKQLPLFIFVIPGMLCFVLSEKGMLTLESPDHALPTLIATILPIGVKGLVVAGLLAALMSSLSSVFNSCSTLLTYDFYKQWKPEASEKQLIRFGQVATAVLVVLGLLWIPLMKLIEGTLFKYLQSVQAYISPPIAAVFLLGIFIKRLNAKGAIAALYTGFALGIGRLVLEMKKADLTGVLFDFADINFLHFALILFVICSAILITVSLLTEFSFNEKLKDITYDYKAKWDINADTKRDIILSALLIVIIAIIWVYFS
jgi:SSS family solute:Na+ symporter